MIQTIKLNNGVEVPQLGFGTWKLKPLGEAHTAVIWAIEAGYRHIDTARIYFNERSVGKAIADSNVPREQIFVVTKLWNGDHNDVQAAFDKSRRRLGLDYVDMYLMHYPVTETRLQAWAEMEKIYASGKARAIGVSNFTIPHLQELLAKTKVIPAVNQVEFHPFLYQKELLAYCQSQSIAVEAYSPLAHGRRMEHSLLSQLAKKYDKTNAQIMIRWSIEHGNIVIPKSKSKERLKENFQVFDFTLDDQEVAKINALHENLRTCWDPTNTP